MENIKTNKSKAKKPSFMRLFLQNIKKDKLALIGVVLFVIFIFVAIFADNLAPFDPDARHTGADGKILRLSPPIAGHPFGTTDVGRDIFSQVILGTRTALIVGFIAAILVTLLGSTLGIISGYFGGTVDVIIMRIVDFFYAIPFVPFVIVLSAVLKPSIWNVILAVTILSWRSVARLVRSQVLTISKRPFIKAAKVSGASDLRIMTRYILPNVIPIILLELTFTVNYAILSEASIAFLGFGDPDVSSWGQILHTCFVTGNSRTAWWWILTPGLAIVLLLISIFFISRAMEEVVNPRLRGR